MSDSHEHPHDHDHDHDHGTPGSAPTPIDPGSRAIEEALQSSFVIVKIVMFLLVVLFLFSGVRIVGPQERAVILHYGKPVGVGAEQLLGPGLHWAYPYPIDEVIKVPVGEVQSVTSSTGWYSTSPAQEAANGGAPQSASLNPATEGYELTGDGSIIHARATLRFRITDPLAYLFEFANGSNTVRSVLDNSLIYAATHSSADNAVTNNAGFSELVVAHVNEQIDALHLGITLEPIDVAIAVPGYVRPDFDAVLAATQDKSTMIAAAEGNAQATNRNAQAQASAIINAAEAQRLKYVRQVYADAQSFTNQLAQYRLTPDLVRERLLTETWERVLAEAPDKFVIPSRTGKVPADLWLQISREPPKPRTGGQAP